MKKFIEKFRKTWNIVYIPFVAVGTTMSILAEVLNFKRESSRKKFRIVEIVTWLLQSIGAVFYNITGFFNI